MPSNRLRKPCQVAISDELRAAILEINQDLDFGPDAPGDGDIYLWHATFLMALLVEFVTTVPVVTRTEPAPRLASMEPLLTGVVYIGKGMRSAAAARLDKVLKSHALRFPAAVLVMSEAHITAWERLYTTVVVPEMYAQWGGRTVRVSKRRKADFSAAALIEERAGDQLDVGRTIQETGLSRATVYRLKKTSR